MNAAFIVVRDTSTYIDLSSDLIPRTLPIISVISPATLTIHPAAQNNLTTYNVPIPSID